MRYIRGRYSEEHPRHYLETRWNWRKADYDKDGKGSIRRHVIIANPSSRIFYGSWPEKALFLLLLFFDFRSCVRQLTVKDMQTYFYDQFYKDHGVLTCGNDTTDRVSQYCLPYSHLGQAVTS